MNKWCEHIKSGEGVFKCHYHTWDKQTTGWKFCPLCGKPRPAEKKKLEDVLCETLPKVPHEDVVDHVADAIRSHIIEGLPSVDEIISAWVGKDTFVSGAKSILELVKESIRKA